jgi:glycosyltransferase involved in cell wall biosynthesis
MRVAIYSPYLDTFGGGERYMMTIAETLSSLFEVDVLLDDNLKKIGASYLKDELSKRFNLNLQKVNFIESPFGIGSSSFSRAFFLKKYDILFYLTDGSIFIPSSKKNILHIQSPLIGQPAKGLWGKIKLKKWDEILYNSEFTKKNSLKNWPLKSVVIYPPVDTENIKPLKKEKYILSVGRFFGHLKDKKQATLIESFKQLIKENKIEGWSLNLVGSASKGDEVYIEELKQLSKGYSINFYPNLSFEYLVKMYGQSSIYWHAAGFGEEDPTKMEHFGISTVEAMAGGCVPVVIAKGGQLEIVENEVSGYLWETIDELKTLTAKLILNNKLRQNLAIQAQKKALNFNKAMFSKKILELVK